MNKPQVLYHGSRTLYEILSPHQASGHGEMDNFHGIYAIENRRIASFFALNLHGLTLDSRFEIDFDDSHQAYLTLFQTEIDWDTCGYLYHLDPAPFQQLDMYQWLAKQDVKPLYIEKIDPLQFKQWIIEKT
ncbi:hypothetical protein ACFODO_18015 [Acinetobacter sichuanensis]|uniref:DUF3990 domain-containing protein n=1 Tax=Acinetobacter sichuanensis TaxID=2136183 RepID=A0A371YS09_9GAMM|nr:hypothetical protein [Acinetobacter sichuanensis]RFC84270.1 hypothetical protein C9E89_007470 [Acinetobacter sichuanensis]